jgi:hypothetical protein
MASSPWLRQDNAMPETIDITPTILREIREELAGLRRSDLQLTGLISDLGRLVSSLADRFRRIEDDLAAQIRLEIDGRFSYLETRLDAHLDARFDAFEQRMDARFDAFEARVVVLLENRVARE